jgi:general secretion pathway protein G
MRNRVSQLGFTLIELLVAATILGILTTIGLASYRVANQKARDGKRKADMEQVRSALEIYRTEEGTYPDTESWDTLMSDLVTYISSPNISDPKPDPHPGYTYTAGGNGKTYVICATLEGQTPPDYCLNNP